MAETIEFRLNTLTMGELAMVEEASGLSGTKSLSTHSYLLCLAVMVSASRNGEPVPSWQSLMSRKVLDVQSFSSPRSAASRSAKSPASE